MVIKLQSEICFTNYCGKMFALKWKLWGTGLHLNLSYRNYARRASSIFHDVARRKRAVIDHSDDTLGFKTRVRGDQNKPIQMHLYWLVLVSAALQRHHLIGSDHQNMFWLVCFSLSQLCQLFPQWLGMPGVSLALPPGNFHGNMAVATFCLDWHVPFELCEKLLAWPGTVVGNVEVKWGMWPHGVQVGWKDAQCL